MGRQINQRMVLEADLRRALAESQFELHHQPIHDADGGVHSLEALLRWQHPSAARCAGCSCRAPSARADRAHRGLGAAHRAASRAPGMTLARWT